MKITLWITNATEKIYQSIFCRDCREKKERKANGLHCLVLISYVLSDEEADGNYIAFLSKWFPFIVPIMICLVYYCQLLCTASFHQQSYILWRKKARMALCCITSISSVRLVPGIHINWHCPLAYLHKWYFKVCGRSQCLKV